MQVSLIERLPGELLLKVSQEMDDFYAVRNLCYAYPSLSTFFDSIVGYFILKGPRVSPVNQVSSKYRSAEKRDEALEEFFANSVSLSRKSTAQTPHVSTLEMEQFCEIKSPLYFHRAGKAPLPLKPLFASMNFGQCYTRHSSNGYLDYLTDSSHEVYRWLGRAIFINPGEELKSLYFEQLFYNRNIDDWFSELIERSKKLTHVVIVIDSIEQSCYVDVCMVLHYLFQVRDPGFELKTDFSIISSKCEYSQGWIFLEHGSLNNDRISLFDSMISVDLKHDALISKEILLNPTYDASPDYKRAYLNHINCKEAEAWPAQLNGFETDFEDELENNESFLKAVDKFMNDIISSERSARFPRRHIGKWIWKYPLSKPDFSLRQLKNFKSYNVALQRTFNELSLAPEWTKSIVNSKPYPISPEFKCLGDEFRNIYKLHGENIYQTYQEFSSVFESVIKKKFINEFNETRLTIDSEVSKSKWYSYMNSVIDGCDTDGVEVTNCWPPSLRKIGEDYLEKGDVRDIGKIVRTRISLFERCMKNLPWLESETLQVRVPLFTNSDGYRENNRMKFVEYQDWLRYYDELVDVLYLE